MQPRDFFCHTNMQFLRRVCLFGIEQTLVVGKTTQRNVRNYTIQLLSGC